MASGKIFAGLVVLGACACGVSGGLAGVSGAFDVSLASGAFYAAILTAGASTFLVGISSRRAAIGPALAALAALLSASLLAPPRTMMDGFEHSGAHLAGFVLYFAAASLLLFAILKFYGRGVEPYGLLVLASAVLAAGCTCCLTPGALRYTGLYLGAPAWVLSRLALVLFAFLLGSLGFWLAGRIGPWLYFTLGIALVYPLEKLSEALVPTLNVGSANLVFLLRYPLWLAGTALVFLSAAAFLPGAWSRRAAAETREGEPSLAS